MKSQENEIKLKKFIIIISIAALCLVMATILNECARDLDSIAIKPTDSPTDEPVITYTPEPSPTPSPTETATDTPTPTPTPTPTIIPDGEYSLSEKYYGKKVIALTFDDGPHRIFTDRLLDGLKERGAKATFFVTSIGKSSSDWESDKRILNRMIAEGHQIGNHTQDHKKLTELTEEEIREQLDIVYNRVKEMTGYDIRIFRPPGGNDNSSVLQVANIPSIRWSVDSRDWEYLSEPALKKYAEEHGITYEEARQERVQYILDALMGRINDPKISFGKIKHGAIILFHDLYDATVDLALALIDELMATDEYVFLTVSEAIESEGIVAASGQIFRTIWPSQRV